jgi:hypothetical protein
VLISFGSAVSFQKHYGADEPTPRSSSFAQVIQNTPCANLQYSNCGFVSPDGLASTAVKTFT